MSLPVLALLIGGWALLSAQAPPDCVYLEADLSRTVEAFQRDGRSAQRDRALEQIARLWGCPMARDERKAIWLLNLETYLLAGMGTPARALERFAELPLLARQAPSAPQLARLYERLGYLHLDAGDLGEAQRSYARALDAFRASDPPQTADVHAEILMDLADTYVLLNARQQALNLYAETERVIAQASDGVPPRGSELRTMLGRLLAEKARLVEDPEEALAAARRAVFLLEGGTPFFLTRARRQLGEQLAQSGQVEAAEAELARALRLARTVGPRVEVAVRVSQAQLALDTGRLLTAQERAQEAVRLATRAELDDWLPAAHAVRGQTALAQATGTQALAQEVEAERHFRAAIRASERHRASLGSRTEALAAFANWQEPYRDLVALMIRQERTAEAFQVLDQTRARYLRDLQRRSFLLRTADPDVQARYDSLTAELADQRARRAARRDSGEAVDLGLQISVTEQIAATERAIDDLLTSTVPPRHALDLEALQLQLAARDQTLVTWFFAGDAATAFVVTGDTLVATPLAVGADSVGRMLERAFENEAASPRPGVDLRPLHALYMALFGPLEPIIPDESRLLLVPEGPLAAVPFAALVTEPPARQGYRDARYLIERHALTIDLAGALALREPDLARAAVPLAAFGRSRFEGDSVLVPGGAALPFQNLPRVRDELDAVRSHVPGAQVALDERATESNVAEMAVRSQVLHFATHAVPDPTLPLYGYLQLWRDSADDDGAFYFYELGSVRFMADLVVLSACETARGENTSGEGMIGLQYAFRAAGARSTVATLWDADDAASVALMDALYGHLAAGLPKDEALRQAQLDFIAAAEGVSASPFFWSAAVLYGDPDPVGWDRGLSAWVWVGLALPFLVFALLVPRLTRP